MPAVKKNATASLDFNALCAALGNKASVKDNEEEDAVTMQRATAKRERIASTPVGDNGIRTHERETKSDKSERYREEGNVRMKNGDYEAAVDFYTRAVNCLGSYGGGGGDDASNALLLSALCNRSAAYAALRKYDEALRDCDAALAVDRAHAKAHSRRGLALYRLGRYAEAAEAYGAAINAGTHANVEELERFRQEALACVARAMPTPTSTSSKNAQRTNGRGGNYVDGFRQKKRFGGTEHVPEATPRQKRLLAKQKHEQQVQRIRAARKLAFAKWRESTCIEAGPFVDEKGGSGTSCTSIDIFGHLRGKCTACNYCQGGWNRDASKVKHWSDTSMLVCSTCGCPHTSHEDCGAVQLDDPVDPDDSEGTNATKLRGVYSAKE